MPTRTPRQPRESDKVYRDLKSTVHKRSAMSAEKSSSSDWERDRPQLRLTTVSTTVTVPRADASAWTPDAFDIGETTGTV